MSFNGANTVATFTPTSSLAASTTYTATVSGAQNSLGHADEQPVLVELHHRRGGPVPVQHLAERGRRPGAVDAADTSAVNLGVQFQAASSGYDHRCPVLQGLGQHRHAYRQPVDRGGTLLATGTFSGESGSGWQELDFSTPVAVTAGTTYVASYHTDTGHYAVTSERAGVGGDERAADRAGRRRRLRLRLGERVPVEQLQRVQLLGRRRVLTLTSSHPEKEYRMKRLALAAAGAAVIGLTACSHSAAPAAAPTSHQPAPPRRSAAASSTAPGRTAQGKGVMAALHAVSSAVTAGDGQSADGGTEAGKAGCRQSRQPPDPRVR